MMHILFRYLRRFATLVIFLVTAVTADAQRLSHADSLFADSNLTAWCTVPFDSSHRTPQQRSEMLNRLRINKLAYDWREKNIPEFDEELDALSAHHITLQAFWLLSDSNPEQNKDVDTVFSFLKRNHVHTEIWFMFVPSAGFDQLPQEEKVRVASKTVRYIAARAGSLGCKVGLYNHEGWYGEPENELAIIKYLKMKNIGIVYNFHHGQMQVDRFPVFFPKILPHLLSLNISGVRKGDPGIYPVGEGDSEAQMIRLVANSGYSGPIGIINESTHPDAETGLVMNMTGLHALLAQMRAQKTDASRQ